MNKCKSCHHQFDDGLQVCPQCGTTHKTESFSVVFLFLAAVIVLVAITVNMSEKLASPSVADTTYRSSTNQKTPDKVTQPVESEAVAMASWQVSTSRDPMTGELMAYANSPEAYPQKVMAFPYENVSSWLGVACTKNRMRAYVGFSESPNLIDTSPENGYSTLYPRIKWDNDLEYVEMLQNWGDKFLHFRNVPAAITKIRGANTVLLELNWYGSSPTYFKYSLNGSSSAVVEIKKLCASN